MKNFPVFTSIRLLGLWVLFSCTSPKRDIAELNPIELNYAQGFEIERGADFWVVSVTQPWTGADQTFRYLILEEDSQQESQGYDAVIQLPVKEVVLTSTTQIPHLDLLGETAKLKGFPNLDLISSGKVWDLIEQNQVIDLGSGPSANIEMLLDMEPDWVMISTLGEDLKNLEVLNRSGIPAVINGEYVEQHPLGRAEWIKFTGLLLGDLEEATAVFEKIEKDYQDALKLVTEGPELPKPTVLSGVLYQDVWFAPGADSWGAQILKNAGGNYIFQNQKGTGSLELSYEYVLDQGMDAEYWIGSADYSSLGEMASAEPRYRSFDAFKNGKIYTYTGKKGPKGGLEYFELGYMRPDWVLKDLIKILHPELLPEYELYFYTQIHE
ncbi:ABC transporter substrate-binding protein [Algoriphagus hitonicola]|uniref:ABC transporter substrate-binding protein n=1 Tax=Algoriphagus hitonicola TaxID=435880 RepID=UPI001FDECB1C|nr:ABC transporter substrate-binding protein [Algoriphagus hitonicola]